MKRVLGVRETLCKKCLIPGGRKNSLSLTPPSLFISSSKMVSAPPTPFYLPEEVRNPLPLRPFSSFLI